MSLNETIFMTNPFDLKTVLLAKHAQHVVLVHFPIALFISAVGFDLVAQLMKLRSLADAVMAGATISERRKEGAVWLPLSFSSADFRAPIYLMKSDSRNWSRPTNDLLVR